MTQQFKNVREQLREKAGQLRQMTQELTNVHDQLQEKDGQLRERTEQLLFSCIIIIYFTHILIVKRYWFLSKK